MSLTLPAVLFQLPSVRRFFSILADDLANRRSLLILLPAGIEPEEIWAVLQAELWRRDFTVAEVSLAGIPRERTPVAVLSEALRIAWTPPDTPRTLGNLLATEQLPDIVIVEHLDQVSPRTCQDWVVFLSQWTQACQTRADRGASSTALCMVVPAVTVLPQPPESSVYLAVHWWWGFPSALEMHMLCRSSSEQDGWDPVARWREYVLPAVTGGDVVLATYLWDDLHMGMEGLLGRLCAFAAQRGWTAEALRTWGAGEGMMSASRDYRRIQRLPPVEIRSLWAHGAIGWTLEYGIELHTAALAVLKRREELQHRLWRGQAELLLPCIDQIRLALCDYLTRAHGPDWPVRGHLPESVEEDAAVRHSPLACQWGHLEVLLKHGAFLRAERHWLPLVSIARYVRNEIAHYRPLTFHDFEGMWREIERVTVSEAVLKFG
jgi:hypothetical protein